MREVAEASRDKPVLVLLKDDGPDSKKLEEALSRIINEYSGSVDACKINAQECIPGYPSRNIPTLILYVDGNAKKNYVGIDQIHPSRKISCYTAILEEVKRFVPI